MLDNNELFNFFDEWKDEPKLKSKEECENIKLDTDDSHTTALYQGAETPSFFKECFFDKKFDDVSIGALKVADLTISPPTLPYGTTTVPDLPIGIINNLSTPIGTDSVITFHDSQICSNSPLDILSADVQALKATIDELRAELDSLKPKELETPRLMLDMAKKNDDTSLLFMKSSKEFDDSMIRMEVFKSRDESPKTFKVQVEGRANEKDWPLYGKDRDETVPETPAHLLWYNRIKKKMNNITSKQAISAPDHFSDLDRKLQEMEITRNYEEALLSTKVTMTFDDAIFAGLASIYKPFKDDEKNFEYAMELVK